MDDDFYPLIDRVMALSKEEYREKVMQPYPLIDALRAELGASAEIYDKFNLPRVGASIYHPTFKYGELEINYSTTIVISKLVDVVRLTFNCTVKNPDPKAWDKRIDTESYFEYFTQEQFDLDEKLTAFFDQHGIRKTTYSEEEYVIPGLDFVHEGMKFFGGQPKARMLFFEDFFDYFSE